jgi:hypothetical protein
MMCVDKLNILKKKVFGAKLLFFEYVAFLFSFFTVSQT